MYRTRGTYKGKYKVKNPEKYLGDLKDVIYRSSWELSFMKWCDLNPNILKWASEPFPIPYVSPLDKKRHRYFPDFYVKLKTKDGQIEEHIIEIKPKNQTRPPQTPKRNTRPRRRRYARENITWRINKSKWTSAETLCENKGWKFTVLTEDELFGTGKVNG